MEIRTPVLKYLIVVLACLVSTVSCSANGRGEGSAPSEARVWVSFGLDRDQLGLASFVSEVGDPEQPRYRKFLSVRQSAQKFGANPATTEEVMSTLKRAGFEGAVEASGGLVVGSFTVSDAEKFFDIALDATTESSGVKKIAPRNELQVPASIAEGVTQVYGGYATLNRPTVTSSTSKSDSSDETPPCPVSSESGPSLSSTLGPLYGLTPLRAAGMTGEGVRVGLLEIDTFSKQAIKLTSKCYRVKLPKVDVVSSNVTRSQLNPTNQESSLDVVALGLAASELSGATIIQFDGRSSIVFPLATAMNLQVKQDQALDVLTASVSFCASSLTQDEEKMAEWLLMSAAATGLTVLSSAGDTGSTGCYPQNKSVDLQYPAASPHTTAIGGTQLEGVGSKELRQSVWNQGPEKDFAGGGGPSNRVPRPDYQSVTGLNESMLQTPDVSFLASPEDVGPIGVCDPGQECDFRTLAGTSATAPGVAGALALIMESFRRDGKNAQLGLLNRAIYRFASGSQYSAAFLDITDGDNDLFGVGCCTATVGYDMASGWGSIKFDKFAEAIADRSSE